MRIQIILSHPDKKQKQSLFGNKMICYFFNYKYIY